MKLAVVTLNRESNKQAIKIKEIYKSSCDLLTLEKNIDPGFKPLVGGLKNNISSILSKYDAVIFIMAMGIIVREISPYIKHKSIDPAVLCLTVDGSYIIPVLSGHLGGANKLAKEIAVEINAIPIITTASDLLNKKAVDILAMENGLVIDSYKAAKEVTSLIIDNRKVDIVTEVSTNISNAVPVKLYKMSPETKGLIYISYKTNLHPGLLFSQLIPKCLILGIGARRDTPYRDIQSFVQKTLLKFNIDIRGVKLVTSIDLKKDEAGIIELCNCLNVPFVTYDANQLNSVMFHFKESEFVKKSVGVGAVSMPCGYLGSNRGECIVKKVTENGITLSIWEEKH